MNFWSSPNARSAAFIPAASPSKVKITSPVVVAQASTATSTRLRNEPNAYNVIEVDGDRVGFGVRVWDGSLFRYRASGRFIRREGHWVRD